MQRSALGVCAVALAAFGCATPKNPIAAHLPEPLLHTRRSAQGNVPAPRPESARHRIARPAWLASASIRLNPAELIPPRGIENGRWKSIVVHHSASPSATPRSMHEYHLKKRGWANGLGYHFVIGNGVNYPDGKIYVGPRWKAQESGAHCKSASGRYFGGWRPSNYFNTHGIGICLIGNFENGSPTPKQLAALEKLTQFLCARTGIAPRHIYGHGEVTHKTACPGRRLNLARIRRAVTRLNAAGYRQ